MARDEYEVHTTFSDDKVWFNGVGDDAHEWFIFDRLDRDKGGFCKTARKPYDIIVVAALVRLRFYYEDRVKISSDGDTDDWEAGRLLCEQVCGVGTVPPSIRVADSSKRVPVLPPTRVLRPHRRILFTD